LASNNITNDIEIANNDITQDELSQEKNMVIMESNEINEDHVIQEV
jgi:hypothetical protein